MEWKSFFFWIAIASEICDVLGTSTYQKQGCYEEHIGGIIIFNDRYNIDWWQFPAYVQNLTKKCELEAKKRHYSYFSIRFYGICVGLNVTNIGKHKSNCKDTAYKPCDDLSTADCVGAEWSDYVYLVGQNGGYGKWSDWGPCSVTCGNGFSERRRECDSPVKLGNGKPCTVLGPRTETSLCTRPSCGNDGGFGEWSDFSICSATCGGGVQIRTRDCNNPKPVNGSKDCIGVKEETRGCKNDFCLGTDGVTKAQALVDGFLKSFYNSTNPGKPVSGKFMKAIFKIQEAVAAEFTSVDPTSRKPVEVLLKELEEFLLKAAEGGSIDFARVTLGKALFNFMKKEIANGLPMDDMSKASEGYLKWVKSQVGEDKFSRIISSQGASTLMFVMDTTGSMSDEINAAKGIAKSIIDITREFPVDYILSPFNDPGVGPVVYKSEKQRAEVISAITNLRIDGGGDCPELAFAGMLNAFTKGPQYGSPMFVYTDASAKDDSRSNINALKAVASSYSSPITFFANLDGCGSGIDSFKEIASYTSGQVFPLKNDKEILSFTEFVKTSLQQDTVIVTGETIHSRVTRQLAEISHDFVVDEGIEMIIVSVLTNVENAVGLVKLQYQDGSLLSPTITTSMAQIYQVSKSRKSLFGKWTITFPSNSVNYKYSVQAVSHDPIEFAYSFIYQQNPLKNSPAYTFSNPIKDHENDMIIRVKGENVDLSTLNCQIVDLKGSTLLNLSLNKRDNNMFSAKLLPPHLPFKVRCYGRTTNGSLFERLSLEVSTAKSAFMIPIFAGNMFTASLSTIVDVQIMVFNFGAEESITFSVKSSHGSVSLVKQTLSVRRSTFLQFKYNAPSNSNLIGATERITVSAQRDVTKEEFSTSFNILLV